MSGYYRVSTYFFAKFIDDLFLIRLPPSVTFSLLAYFMMGLQRTVVKFFIFLLTVFAISVFGSALCFFLATATPNFGKYGTKFLKITVHESPFDK